MFSKIRITHRLIILVCTIQVIVISIVFVLDNNSRQLLDSTDWIIHTEKALKSISSIEKKIVDLETGQRGFLITGKESYLEPFLASKEVIYDDLMAFELLTSDNPVQTREVQALRLVLDQKIAELEQTIELRRNVGFEEAKEIVDSDLGKNLMDEIMLHTNHLRDEELRLLALRSLVPEEARSNTTTILIYVLAFDIIAIVFMSIGFISSINKPLKKLRMGMGKIGAGNLEHRIELDTEDELGQLSDSFNKMLDKLQETTTSNENLTQEIDIRKKYEEELVVKNKKINDANLQLRLQEEELKVSNQDLEQFAYITSHDLQEPLKTIQMFTSLAEKEPSVLNNEKLTQFIDIISNTSRGMSDKINDLLHYSRLGRDRKQEKIDTDLLLKEVVNNLSKTIQDTNASIESEHLPCVTGNQTELSLLFQNIMSNAIKFRKEGVKPIIKISGKKAEDLVHFTIEDNGIGIDASHIDQIFDMFKRLHLEEDFSGTGIGLAQCRKIVNLHEGDIWVESELGRGSQFHFTITAAS